MYNLDDEDVKRMYNLHGNVKHHFPWFDDYVEESKTFTEFQIQKYWASRIDLIDKKVDILNSGIGYFAVPFCYQRGASSVHLYDMDPTVRELSWRINSVYTDRDFIHHQQNVTFDYKHCRKEADIIINTSCEHSYPMAKLIFDRSTGDKLLDDGVDKLCVMSGNNLTKRGHINLIKSLDQLKEQCNLTEILNEDVMDFEYEDDLGKRTYQQFFLIGIKRKNDY